MTLLREVAQAAGVRIDWNKLVKNTSTGISCVREYQLLWRHLAYRHTLLDNVDSVADSLVSLTIFFKFLLMTMDLPYL